MARKRAALSRLLIDPKNVMTRKVGAHTWVTDRFMIIRSDLVKGEVKPKGIGVDLVKPLKRHQIEKILSSRNSRRIPARISNTTIPTGYLTGRNQTRSVLIDGSHVRAANPKPFQALREAGLSPFLDLDNPNQLLWFGVVNKRQVLFAVQMSVRITSSALEALTHEAYDAGFEAARAGFYEEGKNKGWHDYSASTRYNPTIPRRKRKNVKINPEVKVLEVSP